MSETTWSRGYWYIGIVKISKRRSLQQMSETTLTDGAPVTADHRELKENGQQKGYVVLSEEERAKGFVRPVRASYVHVGKLTQLVNDAGDDTHQVRIGGCGTKTTMAMSIAETYARDPKFYSGTFCCGCGKHLPLNEFVWDGTEEEVGS